MFRHNLGIGINTLSTGGGVTANTIRQRDGAVIRDRAGSTIQVRS